MDLFNIISLIGGILTGVTALIVALRTKHKVKAETADKITEAAERLVTMNREEMDRMSKKLTCMEDDVEGCHSKLDHLEVEVDSLRKENITLRRMFELIYGQIKDLGVQPRCEPFWRDNQ